MAASLDQTKRNQTKFSIGVYLIGLSLILLPLYLWNAVDLLFDARRANNIADHFYSDAITELFQDEPDYPAVGDSLNSYLAGLSKGRWDESEKGQRHASAVGILADMASSPDSSPEELALVKESVYDIGSQAYHGNFTNSWRAVVAMPIGWFFFLFPLSIATFLIHDNYKFRSHRWRNWNLFKPTQPALQDDGISLGYLVGRRSWGVCRDGETDRPRLISEHPRGKMVWPPLSSVEAVCHNGCEVVPSNGNCGPILAGLVGSGCGIYAMKPDRAGDRYWGEVILYGNYVETSKGYKGQYGVPYRICKPLAIRNGILESDIEMLAEDYHLEVVESDTDWKANKEGSQDSGEVTHTGKGAKERYPTG